MVEVTGESFYPGGAANVARNLREFIDGVSVIGTVGTDDSGRQLLELLREQKIETELVLEDPDFRTIVKTRIIARHQQVVRVDREEIRAPTSRAGRADRPPVCARCCPELDAFIFEDYGKGFLSRRARQANFRRSECGRQNRDRGSESAPGRLTGARSPRSNQTGAKRCTPPDFR